MGNIPHFLIAATWPLPVGLAMNTWRISLHCWIGSGCWGMPWSDKHQICGNYILLRAAWMVASKWAGIERASAASVFSLLFSGGFFLSINPSPIFCCCFLWLRAKKPSNRRRTSSPKFDGSLEMPEYSAIRLSPNLTPLTLWCVLIGDTTVLHA